MTIGSIHLFCILIFQLLIVTSLHAQHPKNFRYLNNFSNHAKNQQLNEFLPPEANCSDGLDDNGNGLTDVNESSCYFYFDSINHNCQPTSILWACSSLGIHWINLTTNEERLVCPPLNNEFFVDLAWVPNGKLYVASDSRKIYEVDPLSWAFKPLNFLSTYEFNGITADGSGMLYLTVYNGPQTCDIVKLDLVTNQSERIVRLSDYELLASGDCCFLNGFLYVSCNNYIAKVDIMAKTVEKFKIKNNNIADSWGITTLGDGYLYMSDRTSGIYRLNPVTMEETLVNRFKQTDMLTSGYASYVDACNAPCRKPLVSLGADTVVCTNSTLILNAQADRTVSSFLWSNGANKKTNTITSSGTYWVKVSNKCDTNSDTVVVSSADKPLVTLRKDTFICTFSSIMLRNLQATHQNDNFLWSNNSDQSTLTVTAPGIYWLQMSNVCGSAADTVQIFPKIDSCECFVYIPNAFSPNEDHINDLFQLSSNCILKGSVQIFNRWGQCVYSSEDLGIGWNGLLTGKAQPSGVYVYMVWFSYVNSPGIFTRKGTVTLVR